MAAGQPIRRYVAENAPGKPDCRLCRGAGTKGKPNHLGVYKHCRCISEEAAKAYEAKVERYNEQLKLLHDQRPTLRPKQ